MRFDSKYISCGLCSIFFSTPIFGQMKNDIEWGSANVVMAAIHHPYYPLDDKMIPKIADSLITKSPYLNASTTFSNGKELIEKLSTITAKQGKIGYLVVMGHSGTQGYFAEENAGFYKDSYKVIHHSGKITPLSSKAANVSDLEKAIIEKHIVFSDTSIIVLAGCNTAFEDDNIAYDLMIASNTPVIGAAQKVDLYNGMNLGEEMLGVEDKTFYAYIPTPDSIIKYDLCHSTITISEAIRIVKEKVKLLKKGTVTHPLGAQTF